MSGPVCGHEPRCPAADASDQQAAQAVAAQESQGWQVLCNGLIVFDDTGYLLPTGEIRTPQRSAPGTGSEPAAP